MKKRSFILLFILVGLSACATVRNMYALGATYVDKDFIPDTILTEYEEIYDGIHDDANVTVYKIVYEGKNAFWLKCPRFKKDIIIHNHERINGNQHYFFIHIDGVANDIKVPADQNQPIEVTFYTAGSYAKKHLSFPMVYPMHIDGRPKLTVNYKPVKIY